MKKNKMIIAVIFTFALLTAVFAMSGSGNNDPSKEAQQVKQDSQQIQAEQPEQPDQTKSNETIKDQYGVDTGMTKDEYEKFKDEYFQYQKAHKISRFDRIFNTKINILKAADFRKYQINLDNSLDMCNLNDFIIRSELIIIGTYESVEVSENMNLTYPVTYKVKVNEIIANETEYETIPEYITLKGFNWDIPYEKLKAMKEGLVNKGSQYLMFLTRDDFHYYKKAYEEGSRKTVVTDDCFDPYTFNALSLQEIKDIGFLFMPNEHPYYPGNRRMKLDELKKNAKAINKINDVNNFYKRSYK